MQMEMSREVRIFELHIRCENCLRESLRAVEVPNVDDAPSDEDELMESGFLGSLRFSCRRCEGTIGRLFGVSRRRS
ncbi:Hypothetical protein RG1141_CH01450 [Neorhizobium galegae bv. officinalis bv. officinalis str. HAMBI 1141]|uniref:Uncharacterized protein n=1 Tax=Neorhizobium galegae bv. officinalis bv. officinalis str. HAMBI 1141 TaxID=1028801 RepID=A0A068T5B4_NEOGA|nr:Hypothetical protein RG1141_CH01450 [Neorhizobium galegae bv. officinalis bv. officinalis str. HAMBI 1141]